MTTAIIIPTFNRRETVLFALKSVFEFIPPDHHVIVVDSGSSDGTAEAVRKEFPKVILVQGDSSMWWDAAMNHGIRKARELSCSYALAYNDDNIATPGLFRALADAACLYPDSIISAVCCYLDRPDTTDLTRHFSLGVCEQKGVIASITWIMMSPCRISVQGCVRWICSTVCVRFFP